MHARFVTYDISRVLERDDLIRRVVRDLNELLHVDVSVVIVENWINKYKKKRDYHRFK